MVPKYLDCFPQPFLDDLVKGKCVPFVGAGFSRNAEIPAGMKMPLWDDLGRVLAKAVPDYHYINTLDAISAYCHAYGRTKLVEQLREIQLINKAHPGAVHKSFCKLPFELVCTTNHDFLLEKAYESSHRGCHPIIEEDELAVNMGETDVVLLKIHGDLHRSNRLVLTEDDYDAFIDRYPLLATHVASLLISRTALFIGYNLDDPDFRQIWRIIGNRLGNLRRQAYAITVSAPAHLIARFDQRGVRTINLPGRISDYPIILEKAFNEVGDYWAKQVIQRSAVTEEEPLLELTLPFEAKGRLCLFLVSQSLHSFYSSTIFPLARQHGFTPLTAEEVLPPGDNWTAKITALVRRAEIIVADLTGPSSRTATIQYQLAQSPENSKRTLFLFDDGRSLNDMARFHVIVRPRDLLDPKRLDPFLNSVDSWFKKMAEKLRPVLRKEPLRLLDKKEHRAAVLSAITLLETELRAHLQTEEKRHFVTIGRLLKFALEQGLINQVLFTELTGIIAVRNRLVHDATFSIEGPTARATVEGVMGAIQTVRKKSNVS